MDVTKVSVLMQTFGLFGLKKKALKLLPVMFWVIVFLFLYLKAPSHQFLNNRVNLSTKYDSFHSRIHPAISSHIVQHQ